MPEGLSVFSPANSSDVVVVSPSSDIRESVMPQVPNWEYIGVKNGKGGNGGSRKRRHWLSMLLNPRIQK